ncbi:MAG: hypothetical protein RR483_06370, partial [Clostridia bacterium]
MKGGKGCFYIFFKKIMEDNIEKLKGNSFNFLKENKIIIIFSLIFLLSFFYGNYFFVSCENIKDDVLKNICTYYFNFFTDATYLTRFIRLFCTYSIGLFIVFISGFIPFSKAINIITIFFTGISNGIITAYIFSYSQKSIISNLLLTFVFML